MRTVQMTLDDQLVQTVDLVVKDLHTTRSAFTRAALQQAIARVRMAKLEEQHREGYLQQPPATDEFGVWEAEQAWGETKPAVPPADRHAKTTARRRRGCA